MVQNQHLTESPVSDLALDFSPLLQTFDDLMGHHDRMIDYDTTAGNAEEFLDFVKNQEECQSKWNAAEKLCHRLQLTIQSKDEELSSIRKMIGEVRRHLEGKMELLTKTQQENDRLTSRNNSAKKLLTSLLKENQLPSGTRDKVTTILRVLENGEGASVSLFKAATKGFDNTDLSITQSEDDLDASFAPRTPKRPSLNHDEEEAVPAKRYRGSSVTPKGSPSTLSLGGRFGSTLLRGGALTMRPHAFCKKTVIIPETCGPCGKRILSFHKHVFKCRDCKATCHPQCREQVPLPCVFTATPHTPAKGRQVGVLADYVPTQHPMVPALIQHCVNEIEIRGLETVGLYRVPAPPQKVKQLKNRFLRNKGAPNLAAYDIPVICECVKDFLANLEEPLVGRWMWRDFVHAVKLGDLEERQQEMERIVQENLPAPNQDTLAFLILHLKRVSEQSTTGKATIENLAKVFGPMIAGYSSLELKGADKQKEAKTQQKITVGLFNLPSEFWNKIAYRGNNDEEDMLNIASYSPHIPETPHGVSPSLSTAPRSGASIAKKLFSTDISP